MNEIIKRLSDQEIEAVKKSTADVLERVGFRVTHVELRRLCRKAGAKVNDAGETVASRSLLERAHEKVAEMTMKPCSPHTDRMQSRLTEYFKQEYAKLSPNFKS